MKFVHFLKRHLFAVIAILIILIVFIVGFIMVKNLFFSNKGDQFGNRLDGIDNYNISDTISKVKEELETIEQIKNISDNIVGKRIDFIMDVVSDNEVETSKSYTDKILEQFSEEEKNFFDIQVIITSDDNENYPIIGYKHKSREEFVW